MFKLRLKPDFFLLNFLPVVGDKLPHGIRRQEVVAASVGHHGLGQLGVELLEVGQVDLQTDLKFDNNYVGKELLILY